MEKRTTRNVYDIPIVKCCASCKYKDYEDERHRKCILTDYRVKPNHLCGRWFMNDKLSKAGRGGGNIKKKAYLMYLLENISKGSIDEIRSSFESKYGSIYEVK